jgi:hypothetical protein
MTNGEALYLALIIAAFVAFSVPLAYASRSSREAPRPQPLVAVGAGKRAADA